MISMEKIDRTWAEIVPAKGQSIARRADSAHPLDFFIGYNENQNMQLMLLSDRDIPLPDSSRQILVCSNQRSDGRYAICFILTNSSLRATFISLCWDIMASTYTASDKVSGNLAAVRRFSGWLIMLAKGKGQGLSEAQAKGLLGELLVLQQCCIPAYGFSKAVCGWLGPLYADRDFEFEDSWYEVKAVSASSETISISSFDQLDIEQAGQIVVCRLDKTSAADGNSISLNKIISEICKANADSSSALSTFNLRLMLAGYSDHDPHAEDAYHFSGFEYYNVTDTFPRIRKSELPKGIDGGEYKLTIAELAPWQEA